MPKNTVEDFRGFAAYGGTITVVDEKAKEFKLRVPVGDNESIELNFFDANLSLALEAIARSAYDKGRWDQKVASRKKVKAFLNEIAGDLT